MLVSLLLFPFQTLCVKGQVSFFYDLFRNMHNCKDTWADVVPRTTCNSKNRCFRLSVMLIPWWVFFAWIVFWLASFPSSSPLLVASFCSSWLFFHLTCQSQWEFPLSYGSLNAAAPALLLLDAGGDKHYQSDSPFLLQWFYKGAPQISVQIFLIHSLSSERTVRFCL